MHVIKVQDVFMFQKSSLSTKYNPLSSHADVCAQESAVAENGSSNDVTSRPRTQSFAPGISSYSFAICLVQSTLIR